MLEINLISPKLAPSESQRKIVKTLNKLALITTPVVIISILIVFGITITMRGQIVRLESQKNDLTSKVKSLEATEQQYTLVNDRIEKIKSIKELPNAIVNYEKFVAYSTGLPDGSELVEADLNKDNMKLTYKALSSKDLDEIFSIIYSDTSFDEINLSEFSFRRETGYLFSFELKKNKA